MPLENFNFFGRRPADESRIYRFMKFSKFVSMLKDNGLFFTRADKLGDDFEGSYPPQNIESRPETFRTLGLPEQNWSNVTEYFKKLRYATVCNCWYNKEYESAIMWRSFAAWDEGIVIQSTFGKLVECLERSNIEKEQLRVGPVKYIDYSKETIPEWNPLVPFIHKRNFYEDEHEIRAIVLPPLEEQHALMLDVTREVKGNGQLYEITLSDLIDTVYVAPKSSDSFYEQITKLCQQYFPGQSNIKVEKSAIAGNPSF